MRRIVWFVAVLLIWQLVSAKEVVVLQKQSELYIGNVTQYCVYKKLHKDIELVNRLKYLEVKQKGEVIASFDPVSIDRNSIYIWVGLSPNGKMILFSTSDQGTFICNLRGEILYRLGNDVNATNWWNNRYLVGMIDEDNGENFTKSDLVLVDIRTGEKILIDTEEDIALYPCAKKPYIEYFSLDNIKHTLKIKIKR